MGRIRTIKPEFFADEDLSTLPAETQLLAAALLTYSDDEGYFNANPALVKASTAPLRDDPTTIEQQLQQLSEKRYILIVQDGGKGIGKVVNFGKHQRVSHPTPSRLRPRFESLTEGSGEIPEPSVKDPETFRPEGKGKEGNGTEALPVLRVPIGEVVFDHSMVAQGVLLELRLSGPNLSRNLSDVAKAEIASGADGLKLMQRMAESGRQYLEAKSAGKFSFPVGLEKFYGESLWRDPRLWPWKEGHGPPTEQKRVLAIDKL